MPSSSSSSTSSDPSTAAPTIALSAQPGSVSAGTSVTLSWTATNATSVSIDNGIGTVALTGSMNVAPTATTTYTATASSASASAKSSTTITVTTSPVSTPTITLTATPASIASGGSSTLTWTSTNATSVTIDNGIGTVALNSSASSPLTVKPSVTTTYTATASNGGTPVVSSATVTVTNPPPPSSVSVPTWHGDNARSGLNANETILTPTNVASGKFGRLFSYLVDGYIYAQPLYVSNLTINGAKHNVVFVATEYDSVYAFDADDSSVGQLWKTPLLQAGETPLAGGNPKPWIGVTATPAIDMSSSTMYVVSAQKTASGNNFRLHALDILTGQEKSGSPVVINASVPSSIAPGGVMQLTTSCLSRASLLVTSTSVVFGMGGCGPGWVLAYNKSTLKQTGALNTSPNIAGYGQYPGAGGVWMGGAGPAADSAENIYVTTGDGPYDGNSSWGVSALKLKNTDLSLLDSFTPGDQPYLWCRDSDLAAGGVSVAPGGTQIMVGGKAGIVYLLNTGNMGKMQPERYRRCAVVLLGWWRISGTAMHGRQRQPRSARLYRPVSAFQHRSLVQRVCIYRRRSRSHSSVHLCGRQVDTRHGLAANIE